MKKQKITVSSLQVHAEDHRKKKRDYLIAMAIRVLCILAFPFLRGWWLILPALGAIFIPYFAVVIANVATPPDKASGINREIEFTKNDGNTNERN